MADDFPVLASPVATPLLIPPAGVSHASEAASDDDDFAEWDTLPLLLQSDALLNDIAEQ